MQCRLGKQKMRRPGKCKEPKQASRLREDGGGEVDNGVDAAELLQEEDGAAYEHPLVAQQLLQSDCRVCRSTALHICNTTHNGLDRLRNSG